jgi:hypothetical protein
MTTPATNVKAHFSHSIALTGDAVSAQSSLKAIKRPLFGR